ncbi:MAG: protein translocase subunit SecF [Anaerolineales bacterium]|jgi:preprotein translocase subunit SecF
MNIMGKRYWFFGLSLAIIIPGMIFLAIGGLHPAIDFTGGSLLQLQFTSGRAPQPAAVEQAMSRLGIAGSTVQTVGSDSIAIQAQQMDTTTKDKVVKAISAQFGAATVSQFQSVGPALGSEVAQRAAEAVALAAVAITLYITYAFRRVANAQRFGIAAVVAMIHDVCVVIGVEAILGHFLGWQADSLFLTALLTVIGFSVHDTIVVFDRIRENELTYKRVPFETIVNHSVVQTLDRSINTSLTVLLTLLALALFGGETTRHFVLILLVGMASGTYSSIFNAAAILVVWENREWHTWFRRRSAQPAAS